MVLGTQVKALIVLSTLLACSCAAVEDRVLVTDAVAIADLQLKVEDQDGRCVVISSNSADLNLLEAGPKPPCYFARASDGGLLYFSYPDVSVDAALVLIGTSVSDPKRELWDLEADAVCGEQAQGVLVKGREIALSKEILDGGVFCRDTGLDEKMFWGLSHQ